MLDRRLSAVLLVVVGLVWGNHMGIMRWILPYPAATLVNFTTLVKTTRNNQYLVCSLGRCAEQADRASPHFAVTASTLLQAFTDVALADGDTILLHHWPELQQSQFVQRSKWVGWPDLISAQAVETQQGATLAIYSRSVYGSTDFGVNKARIDRWVDHLADTLKSVPLPAN